MTRQDAIDSHHGQTFYHKWLKNADGSSVRCRVNGKCKTWKRDVNRFVLPVKHGLRDCFYLTTGNMAEWLVEDPSEMPELIREVAAKSVGLALDTPWQIVHDKLVDVGREAAAQKLKEKFDG